jgi:hypothetical protein
MYPIHSPIPGHKGDHLFSDEYFSSFISYEFVLTNWYDTLCLSIPKVLRKGHFLFIPCGHCDSFLPLYFHDFFVMQNIVSAGAQCVTPLPPPFSHHHHTFPLTPRYSFAATTSYHIIYLTMVKSRSKGAVMGAVRVVLLVLVILAPPPPARARPPLVPPRMLMAPLWPPPAQWCHSLA